MLLPPAIILIVYFELIVSSSNAIKLSLHISDGCGNVFGKEKPRGSVNTC